MDIGDILTVLWPYLAALYVLDCLLVVRGGHLLFSGTTFSGFRARGAGLRLAGLFPWDWSILSVREPLILSETGLYVRAFPFPDDHRPLGPDDLEFIPYEVISNVSRDGRKVIIDGKVIHTAPTGVVAGHLAGKIRTILNTPVGDRRKVVGAVMAAAYDLQAIRDAVEGIKRFTSFLLFASTLLFILVFVSIPVSLLIRIPLPWLWGEMVLIGVVYFLIVALWWKAHGTLLPGESGDRLEELMIFVFFPVSTMHAFGKLTRRLLAPFDNVALNVVLDPEGAAEVLKREYIRVWAAAAGSGGGEALETVWEARTGILEKLAREAGVDLTSTRIQPEASGGEMVCPLCVATYREGITECVDCRVPLRTQEILEEATDKGAHP